MTVYFKNIILRLNKGIPFLISNKLIRNVSWLYFAHFARYFFPIITIPFLARVLGASSWGILLFFQAYSTYLALIIEFGFGVSATRDVSRLRHEENALSNIVSCVLAGQFILILITIAGSLILLPFVDYFREYNRLLIWAFLAGVFQGLSPLWFFQGKEQMKFVALLDVFSKLLSTLAIFLLIKTKNDGWLVLASLSLANIISFSIGFYKIFTEYKLRMPSLKEVRIFLVESSILFWVRAGMSLFSAGNVFVIGIYLSPAYVAYFASAEKITTAIRSLLNPIVNALYPQLTYQISKNKFQGARLLRKTAIIVGCLGLLLSIITFLSAGLIIKIFLGSEYADSIQILRILSLLPFIISISLTLGYQWLIPLGLEKQYTVVLVAGGVINFFIVIALLENKISLNWIAGSIVIVQFLSILGYFIIIIKNKLNPFSASFKQLN